MSTSTWAGQPIPLPGSRVDPGPGADLGPSTVIASCYLRDDDTAEVVLLLVLREVAPYYAVIEHDRTAGMTVLLGTHGNINHAVADYADNGGDV